MLSTILLTALATSNYWHVSKVQDVIWVTPHYLAPTSKKLSTHDDHTRAYQAGCQLTCRSFAEKPRPKDCAKHIVVVGNHPHGGCTRFGGTCSRSGWQDRPEFFCTSVAEAP